MQRAPSGRRLGVEGAAVALVLVVGLVFSGPTFGKGPSWEWDGVGRLVAFGDIHGRPDQLKSLLLGTGLTDDQLRWTGGQDHLVFCGDLIDRGPGDREVMDLVLRLQGEAESAGGRVHVVLGNHEVMNLVRDLRYVRPEAYAAFEKDEKSGDRKKALSGYEKAHSRKGLTSAQIRAGFDEKYPPGYFARVRAFAPKGAYGSWLLEQPTVIKVNGVLFVHGGLTPEVAALGLKQINERIGKSLRSVVDASFVLDTLVRTPAGFREIRGAAAAVLKQRRGDRRFTNAAKNLTEGLGTLAFAPEGPVWYRGSSLQNERIERDLVSAALERLDARAIVVGHTVTKTGRVSSRFNGRVLRSDVGMGYGRKGLAIVFEGQETSVLDPITRQASLPLVEPTQGEGWAGGSVHLADAELERVLSEGEIVERTKVSRRGQQAELWELKAKGVHMRGIFKDIEEKRPGGKRVSSRRYEHEVAAYKLDRMLDLGMVPPVVLRDPGDGSGAVRAIIEDALDLVSMRTYQGLEGATREETLRSIAETYGLGIDELTEQVIQARVFDGLIGNQDREDDDKLFVPAEGRVSLVDHEQAFSLSTDLDLTLLQPCRPIPAEYRNALMMLDQDELGSALGEYVSEGQIDAVLKRRDRILEICGE